MRVVINERIILYREIKKVKQKKKIKIKLNHLNFQKLFFFFFHSASISKLASWVKIADVKSKHGGI